MVNVLCWNKKKESEMATVKKDNKLMALLSVWGILLVLLGHSGFEEPEIQQKHE